MLEAIQNSALSHLLTSQQWAITANSKQILETLHFTAFALQIGAVMVISLRLLGLGRQVPVAALTRPVFRTAWIAFVAVLVTGALQFIPIATEIFHRPSFRVKLGVLAVALVMLAWLQAGVRRGAKEWDTGARVPASLKACAALSLFLWPAVVVIARLMYAIKQMSEV